MAPTPFSSPSTPSSQAAGPEKRSEAAREDARFAALPERAPLGKPRGEMFSAPPPAPAPAPVAAPEVPAKPVPPAMPYRVAGTVKHDGVSKVVLAKGDAVLPVEEGDTLEGGYRVEAIGADEITLVYTPLGISERLTLAASPDRQVPAGTTAAAGGSRTAQVRWEGPERVQAGNAFNVTLKVTSEEPLRASPLQVSFDAQLLEAVAVRPGRFFGADASFSYRVNPQGSIFVGASGQGGVAADAELVVLTFKPIRPAASTEVKISSLQLQGAVGKPIAVEPVSAFRTAITP
jgi:hypothetical protein